MAEAIKYVITVDANGMTTAINQATGEAVKLESILKKTGETGQKANKDLTQSMKDLGQAYIGVKTFLTDAYNFTKQFTEASVAQTQATKNLTQEQIAYSAVLEEQTGVNDTLISQAQTSLETMGLNNEQVKEATKYTADLVNGGISLEDAMKKSAAMVTKNYGELGELIPAIKTATTEQEKQSLANDYFAKKAELSKQSMEGMAGAEKRMANEITDVKEKFGDALNIALLPMLQALTPMVKLVGDNMPTALAILSGAIFAKAIPAMIALVTQIRSAGVATAFATGGLSALGGILGSLAMVGGSAWLSYNAGVKDAVDNTKEFNELTKISREELDKKYEKSQNEQKKLADRANLFLGELKKLEEEINKIGMKSPLSRLRAKELIDQFESITKSRELTLSQLEEEKKKTEVIGLEIDRRKKLAIISFNDSKKIDEETLKKQKEINDLSKNIEKEYLDKVRQSKLESYNLERDQAMTSSRNTVDNLNKLLEEEKITRKAYNTAILADKEILTEKIKDINQKETEENSKKETEILEKQKTINDEALANQQAHNEKIKSLQQDNLNYTLEGYSLVESQINQSYENDLDNYTKLLNDKKITQEQFTEYEVELNKKAELSKVKARQQTVEAEGKLGLQRLQDLKVFGKAGADVAKASAIAETTWSTYEGAQKSYTSLAGIPVVGTILGAIAASVAIASGIARISAITSTGTGFFKGGYTGGSSKYEEVGVVHGMEFVNDAETTARVGVPALEMLQRNEAVIVPVANYESPEYVGNTTSNAIDSMNGTVGALSANLSNNSQRDVLVINNSDFVKVTRKVEDTKVYNRSIEKNKSIRSYANDNS